MLLCFHGCSLVFWLFYLRLFSPGSLPPEIVQMGPESVQLYLDALKEGSEQVYNIRLMIIGHWNVGKTSLTRRLLRTVSTSPPIESTNGIDIHQCSVRLSDGKWLSQDTGRNRRQLTSYIDSSGQYRVLYTVSKIRIRFRFLWITVLAPTCDDLYREIANNKLNRNI
jgi:predicted GTPase